MRLDGQTDRQTHSSQYFASLAWKNNLRSTTANALKALATLNN